MTFNTKTRSSENTVSRLSVDDTVSLKTPILGSQSLASHLHAPDYGLLFVEMGTLKFCDWLIDWQSVTTVHFMWYLRDSYLHSHIVKLLLSVTPHFDAVCFLLFTSLFCVYIRHRNSVVRNASSRLVASIAESLGPGRVLTGIRDITDRMLPTAVQFMLDSSPDTRYSGVKWICIVHHHKCTYDMLTLPIIRHWSSLTCPQPIYLKMQLNL